MGRKRKIETLAVQVHHKEAIEIMNWLLANYPYLEPYLQIIPAGAVYIADPYQLFVWSFDDLHKSADDPTSIQAKLCPRSLKYRY